ncbi:MAG: PD-(D/E)XK nuclease family protein [Alphaproteobacteria bacterium]
MSAAKITPGIYNIPAGTAFARALSAQLIRESEGRPEALATYRVILPTRRAVRVLHEAFLDESGGKPLLLPRMHALGDIDEEELSLAALGAENTPPDWLDIPPALPRLKRQVLLAKLVARLPEYARNFDQALLLADALGRLMDHVHTENLDLGKLPSLVSAEKLAEHWQVTLEFLDILGNNWPGILATEGAIEAADRRNRLLQALARHWRESPPQTPIIAAGTTGTIPATASLLKVIAALPQGRVVLPGLDTGMDKESWDYLGETHPQHAMKSLLEILETSRSKVGLWPGCSTDKQAERRWLAGEIMRPAETTEHWMQTLRGDKTAQQKINKVLKNINILTCTTEHEEAAAIAVLLRGVLETPGRTAALVTPRRALARRVTAACRRWGIEIDDSAGRKLGETRAGSWVRLMAEAASNNFAPIPALALLKHPFCRLENIHGLDLELRGPAPVPGLKGLLERDKEGIMRVIEPALAWFTDGSSPEKPRKLREITEAHVAALEALAYTSETPWQGQDGEQAAAFFAELLEYADDFPDISLATYAGILNALMGGVTVRPVRGTRPRLRILGQLEARMTDADLVIMAGLNEKTWPPDPGHDPWMSRPMRSEFGLPPPERQVGLAAHDFVQGFCALEVVLSRSLRQDNAPTVPARWLQRLEAVLQAAAISIDTVKDPKPVRWAVALDEPPGPPTPLRRPEPRPPLAARPRKLSVTRIEKWRQDPYGIYAEFVLRLRKLDPLGKEIDAAERGNMLHTVMKNFAAKVPGKIPTDATAILTTLATQEITARRDDPAAWSFWRRRFEKAAHWLAQHEKDWRGSGASPLAAEIPGRVSIQAKGGEFLLTARADRIDSMPGGGAVIDYKSGGQFSPGDITDGHRPQLSLEGLILVRGGFESVSPLQPLSLQYWVLSGGSPPGKVTATKNDLGKVIDDAESGLRRFISVFDDEKTPYYSVPRPADAPRFNDYVHLARIAEWSALGDDDAGTEAA